MSQEGYHSSPEKDDGVLMGEELATVMADEQKRMSKEQEERYNAQQLDTKIDNLEEDVTDIRALSEEVVEAYDEAVARQEQPQLFVHSPLVYRPVDRIRDYSNVGMDTPSVTGDYIRSALFYYQTLELSATNPVVREKAARVLKKITSDWQFLRHKFGKKARY